MLQQLLHLPLIIANASAARAAPPRARLQAEKSEVEVKAHTDLMSASDFK